MPLIKNRSCSFLYRSLIGLSFLASTAVFAKAVPRGVSTSCHGRSSEQLGQGHMLESGEVHQCSMRVRQVQVRNELRRVQVRVAFS